MLLQMLPIYQVLQTLLTVRTLVDLVLVSVNGTSVVEELTQLDRERLEHSLARQFLLYGRGLAKAAANGAGQSNLALFSG